jgi:hypothetical protein
MILSVIHYRQNHVEPTSVLCSVILVHAGIETQKESNYLN